MIHAVYTRPNPKALWHLATVSTSAEVVLKDKETLLQAAIQEGNTEAETGIITFDSIFWAPETLKDLKENIRLLFN